VFVTSCTVIFLMGFALLYLLYLGTVGMLILIVKTMIVVRQVLGYAIPVIDSKKKRKNTELNARRQYYRLEIRQANENLSPE
jgi:hypothetical protein